MFNPVSCHSQIFLFNTPSVKPAHVCWGIVECQKKFNSQGRHPQGIRKSIHWYNCLPTRIIPISELQRKEGGCWLTGELACFPVHKWRFYKTDPDAILLSQSSYFCWFAMSRQILLLRVNYYPWRIPLQESVNKRKSNFQFFKCVCPPMRECPLMGMYKYRVWLGGKKESLKSVHK